MKHLIPLLCLSLDASTFAQQLDLRESIPGVLSLDTRLRGEHAEVDGLKKGDNISLRLRPGYTTPDYEGFQAMVEGEFTFPFDRNAYNAAGVHGDPNKAVIADPENAQLDQLWLRYANEETDTEIKVGRQHIVLDNARFIGDVGWRQNRQTYDASGIRIGYFENVEFYYGYLDQVVRIFGNDAPDTGANAKDFDSDSHLLNLAWSCCEAAKVVGYAYLLDLEDAPGKIAGSDTYGAQFSGTWAYDDQHTLAYHAEYAWQQDAAGNVQDYEADYLHLNVSHSGHGIWASAGYEVLGSEATGGLTEAGARDFASFKTPLATLHKFNGFADKFLVTPDRGLEDAYLALGYTFTCPVTGPWTAKAWYHDFSTDEGSKDLGDEWDGVLIKPLEIPSLAGTVQALAKYANYDGPAGDSERFSVELNYGVSF